MCVALDIFLLHKNSIYSALRNENITFHHLRWSPSLRAEARKEDRLRITATLLGGTHRCVPYCVIVFSFTFSIFYLIYNFSETCPLPFATCKLYNRRNAPRNSSFLTKNPPQREGVLRTDKTDRWETLCKDVFSHFFYKKLTLSV